MSRFRGKQDARRRGRICALLHAFEGAARSTYPTSQQRATHAWRELAHHLRDDTRRRLWTAWGHATGPDGPAELSGLVHDLLREIGG